MEATILHAAVEAEHERIISVRWDADGQSHPPASSASTGSSAIWGSKNWISCSATSRAPRRRR